MKKRALSLLLALCLCLTLLPSLTLAAAPESAVAEVTKTEGGSTTTTYLNNFSELVAALGQTDTTTIKLLKNVTNSENYGDTKIMVNGNHTLNLNGYDLTAVALDKNGHTHLRIVGALTIVNSNMDQTGTFIISQVEVLSSASLQIRGGKLTSLYVYNNTPKNQNIYVDGTMTMSGGTVTCGALELWGPRPGYSNNIGSLTLTQGTINATVNVDNGSLYVSGGTIDKLTATSGTVELSGGEFKEISFGYSKPQSTPFPFASLTDFLKEGYGYFLTANGQPEHPTSYNRDDRFETYIWNVTVKSLSASDEEDTADDPLPVFLAPILAVYDREPFDDVTTRDWFYDAVHYTNDYGLMTGTGYRTFSPDASVTRGMVMTILARHEGIRTDRYSPWYAAGVEWARVNGISDGTNPEAAITREQLATMLYRYAQYKGYDLSGADLTAFADASGASAYSLPALQWAVGAGLMTGTTSSGVGNLLPQQTATRAQLATLLHRFFG